MIDEFYSYIRNLIIFLLFITFLQIIMPNEKYKNYIQLVLGIILIFIMISPLKNIMENIEKVNKKENYSKIIKNNNIKEGNYVENDKKYIEIKNDIINSVFEDNVKKQLEKILDKKYKIIDLEIKLKEDKYYNVEIDEIKLLIKLEEQSDKSKIYVKPFSFDEDSTSLKNFEKNNIKKIISNFYNLNLDNIFITVT